LGVEIDWINYLDIKEVSSKYIWTIEARLYSRNPARKLSEFKKRAGKVGVKYLKGMMIRWQSPRLTPISILCHKKI